VSIKAGESMVSRKKAYRKSKQCIRHINRQD